MSHRGKEKAMHNGVKYFRGLILTAMQDVSEHSAKIERLSRENDNYTSKL